MSQRERVAHEYLAQGRFRKARDEFKLLCKENRPKYLPLLVQANVGLGREMLGKGMVGEARQLLNYLRTIATPEQLIGLEIELEPPTNQGVLVPEVLKVLATCSLGEVERQRLADRAVLTFCQPAANSRPEIATVAGELASLLSSLQAVSERRFDRAQDLLRPLGQASVFSHWKLFIRGLIAFHSGAWDKAEYFFKGTPAATAPGKAGQAYLLLLGALPVSAGSPLPCETVVDAAARIAGAPGCGRALIWAEEAWREKDAVKTYLTLRNGLAGFPAEGLDLLGVLSEFAVNSPLALGFEERETFLDFLDETISEGPCKSPIELQLLLRAAVLAEARDLPDSVVIENWERFLRTREQLHGPNRGLDSEAYGWLGRLMSELDGPGEGSSSSSRQRRAPMRNAREARRLLEKAVTLDPGNLSACLKLCELYQQGRDDLARNRLLDQMAVRFPADKQVLLLAGQACLDRKTFKKGLDYFYQALALDRLDPVIPDMVVKARFLQARGYFQKKLVADARKTMKETARFEVETDTNLTRSGWCLRIQEGVLESTCGEPARGAALLDEARRLSPSKAAFLFYTGFTGLAMAPRAGRSQVYFDELARVAQSEATVADAVLLTRIWSHGRESVPEHLVQKPRKLLEDYLRSSAERPFAREQACLLAEFALARSWFVDASMPVIERRLREDGRDPLFRLYRWRLERSQYGEEIEDDRIELQEIIAEASRRKEDQTMRQARQLLDALHVRPPRPAMPLDDDDSPDGEPGGSWPDPDESLFPFADLLGNLSPDERRVLEDYFSTIANASEQELKRLRQNRPPGISGADFDMMALLARIGGSLPGGDFRQNKPKPPESRPAKPMPFFDPDPNQPDLF